METIEEFTKEYYKNFMDIYNVCNLEDKVKLFFLRSINILIVFFILVGWLLPKKYLLWHIFFCFFAFITIEITDLNLINKYTYDILKKNNKNDNLTESSLIKASQLLPVSNKTIKIILIIVVMMSFIGYIDNTYSGNNIIKKIDEKINDGPNSDTNQYKILTEFKISNNKFNPFKQTLDPINEVINNANNDLSLLNELDFNAKIDNMLDSQSSIVNMDENNLSVFNKIKPIGVNGIDNVNKSLYKLKTEPVNNIIENPINKQIIDREKLLMKLKEFNDYFIK